MRAGEARRRLDLLLVERGFAPTREKARALVMAGAVRCGGVRVEKAGALLPADAPLEVAGPPHPYVSRGGVKLAHALEAFGIAVAGRVCLDLGASTGGFTDCLLQAGAASVIAVDVGAGLLDARLRADPRVHLLERTNVRHLRPADLPAVPSLATADLAFISLTLVLPVLWPLLASPREVVALVKPQFEVGRGQVGKGGVVREPEKHRTAVRRVAAAAVAAGFTVRGLTASPLLGPKGNREFLLHLAEAGKALDDVDAALESVIQASPARVRRS
ncbi:MAG: TlyA family RNA methyltransferase [Candidatus Methylomirabilales bacterium]